MERGRRLSTGDSGSMRSNAKSEANALGGYRNNSPKKNLPEPTQKNLRTANGPKKPTVENQTHDQKSIFYGVSIAALCTVFDGVLGLYRVS